jgi:hypothetical protein
MDKVFLIIISLIVVLIFINPVSKITGLILEEAEVSIKESLVGKITGLDFKSVLNISEVQTITAEFTNIGSLTLTSKIEITIYYYNGTRLDPIAYYYDSYVQLKPGLKRSYKTAFMPPYYGTYYIKVRVPYDTKVTELWGSFSVTFFFPPVPPIIIVVPPAGEGTVTYKIIEAGIPRLTAEYQKNYDLNPGQSILISVNATNTGQVSLLNLRFSTSTTSLIETEINPKTLMILRPNTSSLFLLSVTIPKDTPLGVYPLNFEIICDKTIETGTISLNITSVEISIKDDVYQTILNYDYLISELEKKISDAISEGIDVTNAERSLERAKLGIQIAKEHFYAGNYEDARDRLDEIKKDFEDVVFQLANAQLKFYAAPAFSPFLIIIIAILLAIIFLYLRSRKKEKRPRLLKEVGEET